jgi:hypothetical protein
MKRALISAAAIALASPALAQPGDISCIIGPMERSQAFVFYPTSIARSGVVVGEVSEVEYADMAHDEKYEYGHMPVWSVLANPDGGVTFLSKVDPGLSITITEHGIKPWEGTATLRRDGRVLDTGICSSSQ